MFPVSLPDGSVAMLSELDLWQLLNIRPGCSLDLWENSGSQRRGPPWRTR